MDRVLMRIDSTLYHS